MLVPNERGGGAWNAPVLNHRPSVRSPVLRTGSLTRFGRNYRLKVLEVLADWVIHTCWPVCRLTMPDVCQFPASHASGPEFSIRLPFPNGRSYTNGPPNLALSLGSEEGGHANQDRVLILAQSDRAAFDEFLIGPIPPVLASGQNAFDHLHLAGKGELLQLLVGTR